MSINVQARIARVSRHGVSNAAQIIGATPEAVRAVLRVESAGSGYDKRGRVLILFEPHVFWRCLPKAKRGQAQMQGLAYPKWKRNYPADSYPRLLKAIEIDEEAAFKACSYGLPQILGENHIQTGYKTARAMFEAFRDGGEDEHLAAMARFIKANPQMRAALVRLDFTTFASRYNGPGYKANQYDEKLARAHAHFRRDPWAGLGTEARAAPAPAGQTQADRGRAAINQAKAGAGAAGTVQTATVVATPKPAETPWYIAYAPHMALGLVLAIIAALLIRRAIRERPTERAPVIEGRMPIIEAGA